MKLCLGKSATPGTLPFMKLNILRSRPPHLDFRKPHNWVATWFGCGLMVPAPGTWGTLGGMPFALAFMALGGPALLAIAIVAIIPIGLWATRSFEEETQTHDSSIIVVDEVAGIWIALLPAGLDPILFVAGFFLFRLFDIVKAGPVGWADRKLPGAWGVMADDLIAGVFAALCLWAIKTYAPFGF